MPSPVYALSGLWFCDRSFDKGLAVGHGAAFEAGMRGKVNGAKTVCQSGVELLAFTDDSFEAAGNLEY